MWLEVVDVPSLVGLFATQKFNVNDGGISGIDVMKLNPCDLGGLAANLPVLDRTEGWLRRVSNARDEHEEQEDAQHLTTKLSDRRRKRPVGCKNRGQII